MAFVVRVAIWRLQGRIHVLNNQLFRRKTDTCLAWVFRLCCRGAWVRCGCDRYVFERIWKRSEYCLNIRGELLSYGGWRNDVQRPLYAGMWQGRCRTQTLCGWTNIVCDVRWMRLCLDLFFWFSFFNIRYSRLMYKRLRLHASPKESMHLCCRGIVYESCFVTALSLRYSTQEQNVISFFWEKEIGAAHSSCTGSMIFWDSSFSISTFRIIWFSAQRGMEPNVQVAYFRRGIWCGI